MSKRQLPGGPHAVTREMLERDMARHGETAPVTENAATLEAAIELPAAQTAKPGQLLRGLSADGATASDPKDEQPFAISIDRLNRDLKK